MEPMEAKDATETSSEARKHISNSGMRDSSESRETSTGPTEGESTLVVAMENEPMKAPERSSDPTTTTTTRDSNNVQVKENKMAAPLDTNTEKTVSSEAAHKLTESGQPSEDQKLPASDAGNDQVTLENAHPSLLGVDRVENPEENPLKTASPSETASHALTESGSVVVDTTSSKPPDTQEAASSAMKPEFTTPKPPSTAPAMLQQPFTEMQPHPFNDINTIEDTLQRLRLPLTEKYAPYIHPTDSSLLDARNRLRTALEQTRQLRQAFTDRVYKKYRVILRPVPSSVDAIVDNIAADPVASNRKLQEEIRQIKEEKDMEKKEVQKLAAVKPPVGPDGAPLPNASGNAAETAEQLAFISAGLSLVILPEEDVDDSVIDVSKYEYRGPTNPETGQRVGGLSAASAAAAELLLDRVRRGGAMRIERQRRRQLQLLAGETPETANTSSIMFPSSLHMLSSNERSRRIPERPTGSKAKGTKGARLSPPFPPPGSAKSSRSRISASLSGSALLSLSPNSEELKSDGKLCAATAALISRSVGTTRPVQQRWRHPHPESLGARASTVHTMKKTSELLNAASAGANVPEYIVKSLPPLPQAQSLRDLKPVKVRDVPSAGTKRARAAIQAVLGQFIDVHHAPSISADVTRKDGSEAENDIASTEAGAPADNVETGKSPSGPAETALIHGDPSSQTYVKRRAAEIDLLHSLQYTPEREAKLSSEASSSKVKDTSEPVALNIKTDDRTSSSTAPAESKVSQPPLKPMLAFSVMHALGLVKEVDRGQKEKNTKSRLSLIEVSTFEDDKASTGDENNQPKANLKVLMNKISSRKRTFSDAFLSSTIHSASNPSPRIAATREADERDQTRENVTKKPKGDEETSRDTSDATTSTAGHECPVLSIRGGGGEIVDETDISEDKASSSLPKRDESGVTRKERSTSTSSSDSRARSGSPKSPSRESSLHNQAMLADLTAQQPLSLLQSHHYASDFSPPRSSSSSSGLSPDERSAALRRQHATLHASPSRTLQLTHGTFAVNRLPTSQAHQVSGDLADYFAVQPSSHHSSAYGTHADWSALSTASAAAAGLLPAHTSLASMGLDPHQAAVVSLSVQDRARALLAREQQQNAAAAAHAVAVRRQARMAEFSHAASLVGASSNRGASDFYARSASSSRFSQALPGLSGSLEGSPRRKAKSRKGPKKSNSDSRIGSQRSVSSKSSASRQSRDGNMDDQIDAGVPTTRKKRKKGDEFSAKDFPGEETQKAITALSQNDKEPLRADFSGEASTSDKEDSARSLEQDTARRRVGNPEEKMTKSPPPDRDVPRKEHSETTGSLSGSSSVEELLPTQLATFGMRFFVPDAPGGMPEDVANLIVNGHFHEALDKNEDLSLEPKALIEYLLAVGAAVPIPKALITNPLRERLNTPGFKSQSNNATPSVPREIVIAVVSVWLWAHNKTSFQRAFEKSGRIDVDPECKWLVHTAVDASVRALMLDIADTIARGGSSSSVLGGGRSKGTTDSAKTSGHASLGESDRGSGSSTSMDVHVACIVNQALMAEFCVDDGMDEALPRFDVLVHILDEGRLCALHTKSKERALLAAVISRTATMSEQFSHAYVSAMVRAGEALGHEELFEQVQDEETQTSTMMPYDIFSDERGLWEDSCRGSGESVANITGEDLMRRAHARAMIQKSLKKLQDRHSLRGGAVTAGPYADPPPATSGGTGASGGERPQVQRTPSGSLKRKSSFSGESGTDQSIYNPRHYSAPLFWDVDDLENMPYGKFTKGFRQRSFSLGRSFSGSVDDVDSAGRGRKRPRLARTHSISVSPRMDEDPGSLTRSTREIDWVDVAEIFQPVALAGQTTPTNAKRGDDEETGTTSVKTIIAPFCQKVDEPPTMSDDDVQEEEDISDDAILARHKVVLDAMKQKIDRVMAARQQGLQRARGRGR